MDEQPTQWHKGSRFYRIGSHALYIASSFVFLAGGFRTEFVREAIGAFTLVAGLLLGGSTWTNLKERDTERTRVEVTGRG